MQEKLKISDKKITFYADTFRNVTQKNAISESICTFLTFYSVYIYISSPQITSRTNTTHQT